MAAKRPYDVIVFGASGYTGGLVAAYLAQVAAQEKLRWAIAGRQPEKLEAVKRQLVTNPQNFNPDILIADVTQADSLLAMASRSKVMISTVGPYMAYGEALVRACAEAGTHYVDLTGEPLFVQKMRQKYHALAQVTGARIVNSCGFESIPPDITVLYAIKALQARLGEEAFQQAHVVVKGAAEGASQPSGGTWHSAIGAMASAKQWLHERRPEPRDHVHAIKKPLFYEKNWQRWALNAPTIDPEVVRHSARLRQDYGQQFSYGHFIAHKKLSALAGLVAGVSGLFVLAQFQPSRDWLLRQRQPGQGPSEADRAKGRFALHVTAEANGQKVVAKLSGGDPFYGDTAKMLAEAALCLAKDNDLPNHTGVITPAAAMGEALIPRLSRAGLVFSLQP